MLVLLFSLHADALYSYGVSHISFCESFTTLFTLVRTTVLFVRHPDPELSNGMVYVSLAHQIGKKISQGAEGEGFLAMHAWVVGYGHGHGDCLGIQPFNVLPDT